MVLNTDGVTITGIKVSSGPLKIYVPYEETLDAIELDSPGILEVQVILYAIYDV